MQKYYTIPDKESITHITFYFDNMFEIVSVKTSKIIKSHMEQYLT